MVNESIPSENYIVVFYKKYIFTSRFRSYWDDNLMLIPAFAGSQELPQNQREYIDYPGGD